VYQQKVERLNFEHKIKLKQIIDEGQIRAGARRMLNQALHNELQAKKIVVQQQSEDAAQVGTDEIRRIQEDMRLELITKNDAFDQLLKKTDVKSTQKLEKLQTDLELERRVRIQELTDQKNVHIKSLSLNHEKTYGEMKRYYQEVTKSNFELAKSLTVQCVSSETNRAANVIRIRELIEKSAAVKGPLESALEEVMNLTKQLRGFDRNKDILNEAKARLRSINKKFHETKKCCANLHLDISELEQKTCAGQNAMAANGQSTVKLLESESRSLKAFVVRAEIDLECMESQLKELVSDLAISDAPLDELRTVIRQTFERSTKRDECAK
jgi:hypothetical protein